MMQIRCFMLEITDRVDRKLRRYITGDCPLMPGKYSRHDAAVELDVVQESDKTADWPHDDPRWPKACGCGFVFPESAEWQLFREHLWRRADTAELMTLRNAPPGAMWDAHWFHDHPSYCGPDGKSLIVVCPGGRPWHIDSRASNCTLPNDNVHRCWVRHGSPPLITVDKNGVTCNAGAGSIQTSNWHGFLTNGILSESR